MDVAADNSECPRLRHGVGGVRVVQACARVSLAKWLQQTQRTASGTALRKIASAISVGAADGQVLLEGCGPRHDQESLSSPANGSTCQECAPLEPRLFHDVSEKAYASALRLASWVSGTSTSDLQAMYQEWINDNKFGEDYEPLGDECGDDDLFPQQEKPEEEEAPEVVRVLHSEAAMAAKDEQDPKDEKYPSEISLDLGDVPDKELLENLAMPPEDVEAMEGGVQDPVLDLNPMCPLSLRHAVWCLGQKPLEEEVLDVCWRLLMYLRHWQHGSDRGWISNPRQCRKKSANLNWHQCLVCNGIP